MQPDPNLIAELASDEALEWFDAPRRAIPALVRLLIIISGAILTALAAPAIYALLSGDMAIFAGGWLTYSGAPVTEASDPEVLYGVLLLAAAILASMLLLTALVGAMVRSERYALTNRRIVRLRTFPWQQVKSLNPESVSLIHRDSNTATGSLSIFARASGGLASFLRAFRVPTLILHDIADPANVERLLLARTA